MATAVETGTLILRLLDSPARFACSSPGRGAEARCPTVPVSSCGDRRLAAAPTREQAAGLPRAKRAPTRFSVPLVRIARDGRSSAGPRWPCRTTRWRATLSSVTVYQRLCWNAQQPAHMCRRKRPILARNRVLLRVPKYYCGRSLKRRKQSAREGARSHPLEALIVGSECPLLARSRHSSPRGAARG
jgi:hypothetical protein